MAVKSAVVDNLNHISHFHTFLSQFSRFFQQKPVLGFIVLAGLCHIQIFFGSSLGGGERIPDSRIINHHVWTSEKQGLVSKKLF